MMTPQLQLKLQSQIVRQQQEIDELTTEIFSRQPSIDSAQEEVSRCVAANEQAIALEKNESTDTSLESSAVETTNKALELARSELSRLEEPQNSLKAKLTALENSIKHCQSLIESSAIPQETIDTYLKDIEANELAKTETIRIEKLWQAAHDLEFSAISGVAVGLLVLGVMQRKPVSIAISGWIQSIWTEYYTRKFNGSTNYDFSFAGTCPHSVPEMMAELGM